MNIGIFGGSFDPIHIGHLVLAEYIREGVGLDRVIIMPAHESPFKVGVKMAKDFHRLEMVKIAAAENIGFEVSDYEILKGDVGYTVDTLREYKKKLSPSDRIYFIAGADSFLGMREWKGREELFTTYSFAIGKRPGYMEEKLEAYVKGLRDQYKADIKLVDIPQIDLSSTDIRSRIKKGQSVKYLLSEGVERYIAENGLYGN